MRFTRLVKAIECGTPIEKNGTPPQGGPEKTPEASKKRKKTVVDNADNTVNQNTLLKTVQPAIVGNDSDGGNIAPGDKAGDTSAARKSTTPPNKKVATAKKKIDTSNLASLGTDGLKPVEPEPEFHSPKVGIQVPACRGTC